MKKIWLILLVMLMATAAFAMPRPFHDFRVIEDGKKNTAVQPAPEPVLAIRPWLYEVRKGTLQQVTPTTVYVQGLWDHDDHFFTPGMPIEGIFDQETGEAIAWNWL
jgi:hypothetical protein